MTKNTKIKKLDKSKMRLTSFTKILRNGSTEKVAMVTIPFENILRIYAVYEYARMKDWSPESGLALSSLINFKDYDLDLTCLIINDYLRNWVLQMSHLKKNNQSVKFYFYDQEAINVAYFEMVQRKIFEGEPKYNFKKEVDAFQEMVDNLYEEDIADIIRNQMVQKSVSAYHLPKEKYQELMDKKVPGFVSCTGKLLGVRLIFLTFQELLTQK